MSEELDLDDTPDFLKDDDEVVEELKPTQEPDSSLNLDEQHHPALDSDDEVKMQEQSAVRIQATFKGHKSKTEFRKQRESAVKIQSVYRGHLQRRKYLEQKAATQQPSDNGQEDPSESHAATKIQATFKGHKSRSQFKEQRESAILIQKNFRGYRTRKQLQQSGYVDTLDKTATQDSQPQVGRALTVKTSESLETSFDEDDSVLNKSSGLVGLLEDGTIGELPPQVADAMKKMQTELKKKNMRIMELKEKNKQLVLQGVVKPDTTPEATKLKDQNAEMKRRIAEDEKLLRQRAEELEDLKKNYERVTKILQSKKVEVQGKNQSNSWKQELVKRNQDVQAKQLQVEELEKKINLAKTEKEREGNAYKTKLVRVESEMNVLRQELQQLHQFIKDQGLESPSAPLSPFEFNKVSSRASLANRGAPIRSPPKLVPLKNPKSVPVAADLTNPALTAPRVEDKVPFAPAPKMNQHTENPALSAPRITKVNGSQASLPPMTKGHRAKA